MPVFNDSNFHPYGYPNDPIEGFEYWDQHPEYPSDDWELEVRNGTTRAGYWAWVKDQIELKKGENKDG